MIFVLRFGSLEYEIWMKEISSSRIDRFLIVDAVLDKPYL